MKSQIVLELNPTPGNARNSEGAFVTLNDGRLLFAWSKFLSDQGGDHEPSVIVARTSDDGGLTWNDDERILAQPENGAHNLMSASLLRLQNGRILFLSLSKKNFPDGGHQCQPLARFSDDEMATISAATPLTLSTDYHVVNNDRLIQLRDGTLIVPVAQHRFGMPAQIPAQGKPQPQFKHAALIFYLISKDNGETWVESKNSYYRSFEDGSGLQEPGVVELNDGRLWSWTRTSWKDADDVAHQWQSFSENAGQNWSEPTPSVFASPCSPLSMKRIPKTGDLLAVWNDHSGRFPVSLKGDFQNRTPLVCAVSSDEGITWKHHQIVEDSPEHGFCYTAIHFVDDAVLLAYCAGGPAPQNCLQRLRMRRIEMSDVYSV